MLKFFWFSLPITLLIIYIIYRACTSNPLSRRDINMIFSIYLIFYLFITAGLGLFWVARMDLPAFDLHYLFGYCLLFLVSIHLWFQLPHVFFWLKKNSPAKLLNESGSDWKPAVKTTFIYVTGAIFFSATTIIVYEFLNPATVTILEEPSNENTPAKHTIIKNGDKMLATEYIHQLGNVTRTSTFVPRFYFSEPKLYKSYEGHEVVTLPAPTQHADITLTDALSQHKTTSSVEINLQILSNLLYYANGVTDTRYYPSGALQLRAAASAGALYPNDLYIAAMNVTGLAPGIYYYHPGNHSLILVGDKTALSTLANASPYPNLFKNSPAAIVVTAYFDRSIWKYFDRAYRYVLPDAGHILSNLALTTNALNIPYTTTSFFDDAMMSNALSLSPQDEGALSLILLGANTTKPTKQIPKYSGIDLPKKASDIEATHLSHQLTSIKWTAGTLPTPSVEKHTAIDRNLIADTLIQLPSYQTVKSDLFNVIINRRSYRQFSPREATLKDFTSIIQDAFAPLHNTHLVADGQRVNLFLIVNHVRGLTKGIYRYIPEKSSLQKIAEGDYSSQIYQVGLSQEVLKRAAFVMAWVIDLNKVGALHGDRDYRDANLECGIGSETAYLAAESRGLGAYAVGAFYDHELQTLLKLNETQQNAILLTAIGTKT